jgi:hypothetical protein
VQDKIVLRFLSRAALSPDDDGTLAHVLPGPEAAAGQVECLLPEVPVRERWVVFTAGPMGAGKTHTLRWMAKKGFFPLDTFVHADPDLIRNELPEIQGYIARDPQRAGSLTHKEAG